MERRTVTMLVTVSTADGNFTAGGTYSLPTAIADELVDEKAARYVKNLLKQPKDVVDARRTDETWRDTIRPGDAFPWQVTVNLPLFTRPHILARNEPRPTPPRNRSTHHLQEVGGDGPRVSPPQAQAIDHLVKNEATLLPKALRATAIYADQFRPDWEALDRRLADRVAPRNMGPRQVAQRIRFRTIYFPRRSRDGIGYVELHGECTWDREHGFSLVLHRNRVVGIWQQGTGWRDRSR
jgi:hypothetical protein